MSRLFTLALLCALPALSAPKWLRRATLAAACAASATDAVTTWQGKQIGLREANAIFRGADGTPAMGRVISLKTGLCAYSIWSQERSEHSTIHTVTNVAQTALFGFVACDEAAVVSVRSDRRGDGSTEGHRASAYDRGRTEPLRDLLQRLREQPS